MNDEADIVEDPREEIARLESKIEELAEGLDRGRKLAVLSKLLLGGGALWLAAAVLGAINVGAPGAMAAITAILGGFILGGSNRSTMLQTQSAMEAAETRRSALIGAIELRNVNADLKEAQPTGRWLH